LRNNAIPHYDELFPVTLAVAFGVTVTLAGIMGADEVLLMTVGGTVTFAVTFVVTLDVAFGVTVTLAKTVGLVVGVGLTVGLDDVHPARKTVAPTIRTTINDSTQNLLSIFSPHI
jgi:hypothetical protein